MNRTDKAEITFLTALIIWRFACYYNYNCNNINSTNCLFLRCKNTIIYIDTSLSSSSTVMTNNKQPLDRYYRLLERSQSIQKQIHRISSEYSLPPAPPPHPRPSFSPPSLPTTPPKPPSKTTLDTRLPSTPPPTPQKDDPLITPPASPRIKQVRFQEYRQADNVLTVVNNNDNNNNNNNNINRNGGRKKQDNNESPLPPLPPPRELPPITHVQKV